MRVAVVGAGIAGLAAAHQLRRGGLEAVVFEAGASAGGVARTVWRDDFLVDLGPNTLVAREPALLAVIDRLGLREEVVEAPREAAVRYVVRDGRLVPLPDGALALLRTPLLSARGKGRLLAEAFRPAAKGPVARAETVAQFVRRRFGQEVLDYVVDPFVSGIFAGDPERLSVAHALPMLVELEREHGSVIRGGLRRMGRARGTEHRSALRRPFSFRSGMGALPAALARELGDGLRLRHRVRDVLPAQTGFLVTVEAPDGAREEVFDSVVLAVPPDALSQMSVLGEAAREAVAAIPTPPVATIALGFAREEVEHPLRGFGFLVPSREPHRLLGCLFSSSLFPGRAPRGHVLLSCFLGGRRRPADALLDEAGQLRLVLRELNALLGLRGEPRLVYRHVWPRAIPQYEARHGTVLDLLGRAEAAQPGLAVAGSLRRGVSVGDALASGLEAARALLSMRARPR